jgi:glucose-6-phosphate isomerase
MRLIVLQKKKGGLNLNKNPKIKPFVIQYDEIGKKLSEYSVKNDKKLSDIAEFFHDQDSVSKILKSGRDPLIYSYHDKVQPAVEGEFSFGITIIFPGTIGNEFYMTRGHYHGENAGEFYMGLEGNGILILEDQDTKEAQGIYFTRNSIPYIPAGYGHRVVNVGTMPLIFLTVEAALGTHDYDTIRKNGFGILVITDPTSERGYKIIPNPRKSN